MTEDRDPPNRGNEPHNTGAGQQGADAELDAALASVLGELAAPAHASELENESAMVAAMVEVLSPEPAVVVPLETPRSTVALPWLALDVPSIPGN